MAHEWAHVWEIREGNLHPDLKDPAQVPFRGLLFVEGVAQWVALKVMDFFGLRLHMKQVQTWRYDEYGDGVQIVKWLEERSGGVRGVLDFRRSGEYPGGVEQLYYNSGAPQRIEYLRALPASAELPEPHPISSSRRSRTPWERQTGPSVDNVGLKETRIEPRNRYDTRTLAETWAEPEILETRERAPARRVVTLSRK